MATRINTDELSFDPKGATLVTKDEECVLRDPVFSLSIRADSAARCPWRAPVVRRRLIAAPGIASLDRGGFDAVASVGFAADFSPYCPERFYSGVYTSAKFT